MRTEDVLNQINNTLDDWSVGPDGMRSRPETPAATSIEIQQQWQDVREHLVRIHLERARRMQAAMNEAMTALAEAVKPAAEAASRSLAELAKALQQPARDTADGGHRNFRHLPEAIGCNDCGPKPRPRDRPAWQTPYGPPQPRR